MAKHAGHLHLTQTKVEEMLAFKLTAKIVPNESKISFEGDGLGFDVHFKCPFVVRPAQRRVRAASDSSKQNGSSEQKKYFGSSK